MTNNKIQVPVAGMTCASCELLLSSELGRLPGVKSVRASAKQGQVEIEHDQAFDLEEAKTAIARLGYQPQANSRPATAQTWLAPALAALAVLSGLQLLKQLGVFGWLEVNPQSLGFGAAFLIGVAASLSTCLMVVGSVVLAFSAAVPAEAGRRPWRPQLLFHFGRLASFLLLGAALGWLGSGLRPHEQLWAYLTLVIALVLALLALSSLGLTKRLTFGRAWSGVVAAWWQRALASRHPWAPIVIGALTFILPCGFTQSMQLYALGSGSAWQAGGLLFMFALGTLPVLLSLGFAASVIKEKFASLAVQRFFGFLILAFALYIFSSAAAMLGWQWPSWSPAAKGQTAAVAVSEQVVEMTVDGRGFTPNSFRIKRGVPVRWKIKGVAVTGCTNEIMIPELGLRKKIANGDNELVFTADQPGRLNFSCWMGMVRGNFIVE